MMNRRLTKGALKKGNSLGFTLLELVLIVFLLSLTGVGVLISWDLSQPALHGATLKVVKDIRYAQSRAMVTGKMHGFRTLSNSQYEIYQESVGNPIKDPATGQNMQFNLSDAFGNVIFQGTYQVEFDLMGSPTLGGGSTMGLQFGALNKSFTVENNTGRLNLP